MPFLFPHFMSTQALQKPSPPIATLLASLAQDSPLDSRLMTTYARLAASSSPSSLPALLYSLHCCSCHCFSCGFESKTYMYIVRLSGSIVVRIEGEAKE